MSRLEVILVHVLRPHHIGTSQYEGINNNRSLYTLSGSHSQGHCCTWKVSEFCRVLISAAECQPPSHGDCTPADSHVRIPVSLSISDALVWNIGSTASTLIPVSDCDVIRVINHSDGTLTNKTPELDP